MTRWILLAAATLVLTGCDSETVEREIGYTGRARLNPWLAAERFATRMGWQTESTAAWRAPEPSDATWLMPAAVLANESFTRRMDHWVRDGGHLIVFVEHAAAETSDWADAEPPRVPEHALLGMLARAGIQLEQHGGATAEQIAFANRQFKIVASSDAAVRLPGGQAGVFASAAAGKGRLTVITDGRLFRNRWIDQNDHAALLAALLDATGDHGTVGFMRGAGLSLWAMMRTQLWPVLWGLTVLALLWLWKNFARFGPVESAAPPPVLRGYEHHLDALGAFQWRIDRATSLLSPLREQIVELGQQARARAGRRDENYFQFLAERAGLPRERVVRALTEVTPPDAAILARTTADLQQLLNVLHHPNQP